MKTLYVFALIVLVTLAGADDSPALKELKSGNLKFSAKTYKALAKENTGNFLVCPLSVAIVLALVEAGAGGKTATQLITGLDLPDNEEKIQSAIKAITPSLKVDDLYTLTTGNKVYIKQGYGIKPSFKDVATNVYNAEVQEIDFISATAAQQINKWVLEHTHDKIKDVISPDDLDADTRVVLINVIYFHGLWTEPFYETNTKEKAFHVSTKQEVKVKMMDQTENFGYYEDTALKAKFLKMHYYGSPISITFVLPDAIDDLADLEAKIDQVVAVTKYSYEEVHVQLPHVNIEHSIDFIPILKQFGVIDAFDKKANFSGILTSNEHLKLSKVLQKTFIAIEEKGTTAAAATVAIASVDSAFITDPQPPKEFEANHPFIFVVKSPAGIIFIGRFLNPGSS